MDKLHDKLRPPRVPRGGGGPAWQQEPGGPPISGARGCMRSAAWSTPLSKNCVHAAYKGQEESGAAFKTFNSCRTETTVSTCLDKMFD